MKILLYTDNHFSTYSSIIRSRGEKYSKRLENQILSLNWVEKLAEEKGCEMIICLGDFFDKSELNAEELTALKEIEWNKKIKHYFIVGNHEMGSQDLKYNSSNALKEIGEIIFEPTIIGSFGVDLIMLPYILESNRKPLRDYLRSLYIHTFSTCECKNYIILSHNDIKGIRYGQFESKEGFDIKDICEHCDLCINGHLHNQQQINDKVLNLGNLTGQNFSEDASKYSHCAGILDTDTLKIELINNPYAFNFYKISITSIEELEEKLKILKGEWNVLNIKIPQDLIVKVKEYLVNHNEIFTYKLVSVATNKGSKITKQTIKSKDHIQQFKEYIIQSLGDSELVKSELSLL